MNAANKTHVLDHGFVILRNISGPTHRIRDYNEGSYEEGGSIVEKSFDADDTDPANTARMSFDQMDSGRTREQDLKLCEYLMKNKHTTPFEMIEVWLEMKMPIFVARQFVRHRTVSINEVSARYVTLPPEWYIPEIVGGKPVSAKQGQSGELDAAVQQEFRESLNISCETSYSNYLFSMQQGVAAEHARMFLHLNHYTHWIWKQNLHNLMHFLSLRDHSHAQIESQRYAQAIDLLLRQQLPELMALYDKYRRQPALPAGAALLAADNSVMYSVESLLDCEPDWAKSPSAAIEGDKIRTLVINKFGRVLQSYLREPYTWSKEEMHGCGFSFIDSEGQVIDPPSSECLVPNAMPNAAVEVKELKHPDDDIPF